MCEQKTAVHVNAYMSSGLHKHCLFGQARSGELGHMGGTGGCYILASSWKVIEPYVIHIRLGLAPYFLKP